MSKKIKYVCSECGAMCKSYKSCPNCGKYASIYKAMSASKARKLTNQLYGMCEQISATLDAFDNEAHVPGMTHTDFENFFDLCEAAENTLRIASGLIAR